MKITIENENKLKCEFNLPAGINISMVTIPHRETLSVNLFGRWYELPEEIDSFKAKLLTVIK